MDDFFTVASFATLTGSVVAVVVIVNALRHALNWGPRWFGLALSVLVAFVAFYLTTNMGEQPKTANLGWIKALTIIVNGCLIYTSAFGIQNTVVVSSSAAGMSFQSANPNKQGGRPDKLSVRSVW